MQKAEGILWMGWRNDVPDKRLNRVQTGLQGCDVVLGAMPVAQRKGKEMLEQRLKRGFVKIRQQKGQCLLSPIAVRDDDAIEVGALAGRTRCVGP